MMAGGLGLRPRALSLNYSTPLNLRYYSRKATGRNGNTDINISNNATTIALNSGIATTAGTGTGTSTSTTAPHTYNQQSKQRRQRLQQQHPEQFLISYFVTASAVSIIIVIAISAITIVIIAQCWQKTQGTHGSQFTATTQQSDTVLR